jgi:outer membrane protein assembly factor BamB
MWHRMSFQSVIGLAMVLVGLAWAGEPTQTADAEIRSFRNGFGGVFPNAKPPLLWGSPKSIVWKHPLSRRSNASPVLVSERVFVLDEPSKLVCLRATDGQLLWERDNNPAKVLGAECRIQDTPRPSWLSSYGYTTPTPVSDGRRIWCVFGQGVVVCYDLEGQLLWASPVDAADRVAGFAASPCLADGALVVSAKGRDRLCAFDAETGRKLWHIDEGAQDGSCVPLLLNNQVFVVASAGLILDPRRGVIVERGLLGKPLDADAAGEPVNWGPTVAAEHGLAVFHVHFQPDKVQAALRAVRLEPAGACEQKWEFITNRGKDLLGRMGNSPVLHDGLLYAVNDGGLLQVFDAAAGRLEYSQQLPKQSYASLALAGGYLFAFGLQNVTIFRPGCRYEQVAQFKHGFRDFFSSPVFAGRRLYFRDANALWCVEQAVEEVSSSTATSIVPEDAMSPTLADSAKSAPLIPFQEWLLLHDYSRLRVRNFSRAMEWAAAALVLALIARPRRRFWSGIGWPWLVALPVLFLGLASLAGMDRFGNGYLPVAIWTIAGCSFALAHAVDARKLNSAASSTCILPACLGGLMGAAAGLMSHQVPLLLIAAWYVLTGKPI